MSSQEKSESPQVQLMHEWGSGFCKMDLSLIAKHLHKDYRHIRYPRSLGHSDESREEYLHHMGQIMGIWTKNESTIHSIIEAPGKVIAHVTSNLETKVGETTRESIYIAEIITDADGDLKIKQVEEFIDSKTHLDFVRVIMNPGKN